MISKTLTSLLIGFGIYTILFLMLKPIFKKKFVQKLEAFDDSTCILIAGVGFISFAVYLVSIYFTFNFMTSPSENYDFRQRLIGANWFYFWLQPLFIVTSQILWLPQLRKVKWLRLLIALSLLISIRGIIVYFTSLHRDYLPASWSAPLTSLLYKYSWSLGLFGIVALLFHRVRRS